MATLSKLVETCDCNNLIHLNSCSLNAAHNLYRFFLSNAKYFLAILFMPLLLKIKKLNQQIVTETFKCYLEVIFSGTLTGWTISVMMCVIRQLYGKYGQYSSFFVPSLIGAIVTCFTSTKRVQRIFFTAVIQCNVSAIISKRGNIVTQLLANSMAIKTLTFMSCSAVILHAKRHQKFRGFWFLKPNLPCSIRPEIEEPELKLQDPIIGEAKHIRTVRNPLCTHDSHSCFQHITSGVRNYALIGLTLDAFKMLTNSVPIGTQGFLGFVAAKFSTLSLQLPAFLATYIGIYRFTHCYLNHKTQSNQELNHILASFLGGASFLIYPKLTLQSLGIVLSMEVFWRMLRAYKTEQRNELLEQLQGLPATHILYVFSLAQLIDTYFKDKKTVNTLGSMIINRITDDYARIVANNIERKIKGQSPVFIKWF